VDRSFGDGERGVAHDRVGEGGLAGTVWSHEGVNLARLDLEVQAAEDLLVLDAYVKILDL